ncbi:MAG: Gfo/Idh/MocA family oxidoreductase [Acidobacteria bacterium]|nr:Gfo/Idh/MocA family oxidoreductase [Acidobacteriota bacterium]
MSSNVNRRLFLRTASSAAMAASSYAQVRGANDRVRVALVGFSDRARAALVPAFAKVSRAQNFSLVALSDIWSVRRNEGAGFINRLTDTPVAKVRNNDELYDRKDIDAVIIATADHQHAAHGVEAVKTGRDAYIEKPLANRIQDARAILEAVRSTGRIVQIGTQRRSSTRAARVREFLQSGAFGDINMVQLTANFNQPSRWRRPDVIAALRPEDTDWTRFLAGRSTDSWDPRKYVEFRLFRTYSSGIPDQWMVHQIDLLHMLTGMERPRSVVASGGIYQWADGRENPDTVTAVFEYAQAGGKGFQALFTGRMGNAAGGSRDLYCSSGGTLEVTTGQVSPDGGLTEKAAATAGMKPNLLESRSLGGTGKADAADDSIAAHLENWMQCVRSRRQPIADITAGYNHSVALCMTVAAMRSGRRATFDDKSQQVVLG